jgi:hypothetical protein
VRVRTPAVERLPGDLVREACWLTGSVHLSSNSRSSSASRYHSCDVSAPTSRAHVQTAQAQGASGSGDMYHQGLQHDINPSARCACHRGVLGPFINRCLFCVGRASLPDWIADSRKMPLVARPTGGRTTDRRSCRRRPSPLIGTVLVIRKRLPSAKEREPSADGDHPRHPLVNYNCIPRELT